MSEDLNLERIKAFFFQELKDVILSSYETTDGAKVAILPRDVIKEMLESSEVVDKFLQAFTHKSFDYENNYESVETHGDPLVNSLTSLAIYDQYPELDPDGISKMIAHYKSNEYLALCIGDSIPNLNSLILRGSSQEITIKIKADVFEAFTFVLYNQTERFFHGGGFIACNNFYQKMTASHPMSDEHVKGNPKSIVIEIFGKEFGTVIEDPMKKEIYNPNKGLTVTINEKIYRNFLRDTGLYNSDRIDELIKAGRNRKNSTANDRDTAVRQAYGMLLADLASLDITPEEMEKRKNEETLRNYANSEKLERAKKSKNETLTFKKKPSAEKGMVAWELIATNVETQKKRLVGTLDVLKDPSKFHLAKHELYDFYIKEIKK